MADTQKRSRRQRNAMVTCSHCRSSIQLETFQRHVDLFWHEDQHTWVGIPCPTFPRCGHDHTPSSTELTHINARIAGRKRQRIAGRRRPGSVPADLPAQQAQLLFGAVVPPFPQPPARPPIEESASSDDEDGQLDGGRPQEPPIGPPRPDVQDDPPIIADHEPYMPLYEHNGDGQPPEWMAYRPGSEPLPCSADHLRSIVHSYHLDTETLADVRARIDMVTTYLWFLQSDTSERDMDTLLTLRALGPGGLPFTTTTLAGLRTWLGFSRTKEEQPWDDTNTPSAHLEFQHIPVCGNGDGSCGCCSAYSSLHKVPNQAALCENVPFPDHREEARSQACGWEITHPPLVIRRQLRWKPHWLLMYKSPISYLREHMLRPGYATMNEHWRGRNQQYDTQSGERIGCDFYDFGIWRSFQHNQRMNWSRFGNSLLLFNMDWYQPFKHLTASLGLIWMINLMLPREYRYKRHNVMLVAVFPGFSEKEQNVSRLLEPLARDLLLNWESTPALDDPVQHVAIAAVSCDSPACRKAGGMGFINGSCGCLVCMKRYHYEENDDGNHQGQWHVIGACRLFESTDGVDADGGSLAETCRNCHKTRGAHNELTRDDRLRTRDQMLAASNKWLKATSPNARKQVARETGMKWTPFICLPYWDPSVMLLIDGLHHLWKGVTQAIIAYWVQENVLTAEAITEIEAIMQATTIPSDLGKLRTAVLQDFNRMSAADVMQFVLVFSRVLFTEHIEDPHLGLWLTFLDAVELLSSSSYTPTEIDAVDRATHKFNNLLSSMYADGAFIPKTHEITHCGRSHRLIGPTHVSHTFMFEGLNGRAMNINHNSNQVQLSIMRRWTRTQTVITIGHLCLSALVERQPTLATNTDDATSLPQAIAQMTHCLKTLTPELFTSVDGDGPTAHSDTDVDMFIRRSQHGSACDGSEFLPGGILGGRSNQSLPQTERDMLVNCWRHSGLVPPPGMSSPPPIVCRDRGKSADLGGDVFTSTQSLSTRSSFILMCTQSDDATETDHPGQVTAYFTVDTPWVPQAVANLMQPGEAELKLYEQPAGLAAAINATHARNAAMQLVNRDGVYAREGSRHPTSFFCTTYVAVRRTHCYAIVNWYRPRTGRSAAQRKAKPRWQYRSTETTIVPVHRIKARFIAVSMDSVLHFQAVPIPRRTRIARTYSRD
jgi:hypothetical protein